MAKPRRPTRTALALAALAGGLVGCGTTAPLRTGDDPLLGSPRALSASPASALRSPLPTFPPAVPPGGAPATAALASAPPRPLTGSSELSIGGAGGSGWSGIARPAGVQLQPPAEGGAMPTPAADLVPVSTLPAAGGRAASFEQAQMLLKHYGASEQRLETWATDGEWRFTCSIPNPHNPYNLRRYEARDARPLTAMQIVLDQIVREHP